MIYSTLKKLKVPFFLFQLAVFPTVSFAGNVTLELSFEKKPADVGVFYIEDKPGQSITSTVDQKDKNFINSIIPVSPDSELSFKNSDSVDHNIYANEISDDLNVQFDIGLMSVNSEHKLKPDWKEGSLVRIGCKIHPKMKSYIANISASDYKTHEFDKSETHYSLDLNSKTDSPTIKILLEKYDPLVITAAKGSSQTLDLTSKGKKKGSVKIQHN